MTQPTTGVSQASEVGDEKAERGLLSALVRNVELPERQRQVVGLIARGFSLQEIADKLGLTANTVANHRRAAQLRLGLRAGTAGTVGLVHYALMRHLVELGDVPGETGER